MTVEAPEPTKFQKWWRDSDGWERLIFVTVTAVVGWVFACLVAWATADGAVDRCAILAHTRDDGSVRYALWGHRSWREDKTMGYFPSFGEAVDAANKIGCPLK